MNIHFSWLALIFSGAFSMLWGMIYYGPLFGKIWMKLAGVPKKKPKTETMIKSMALGFLSYMVLAYVLSGLVDKLGYTQWQEGAMLAFWMWLGFIGTSSMGMVLWERKSWKLYFLNNVWSLINLMIIGSTIAIWP